MHFLCICPNASKHSPGRVDHRRPLHVIWVFAIIRVDHRRPLHVIWYLPPSYGSTTVGPYVSFEIFAIIPGRPPSPPMYHLIFFATIPGRPPSTPTYHLVFSPSYGSTTVDPYTSFGFFAIIRVDHRRPLHVIWFFSPSYGSTTVDPYVPFGICRHHTGPTTVDLYTSFVFFATIPGRPPSTPTRHLVFSPSYGSTTVGPYKGVTVGVPGGESLSFLIFLLPALH